MSRRCADLRVEYLRTPLAVATAHPRFSWVADHAQTAYRLTVSGRDGVVWDTGRIAASDTALVPYAGAPLPSDADFSWTVESWDADGGTATGGSTFGTALLDPVADWTAEWAEPAQEPTAVERWSLLDWIRGAADDSAPQTRLRPPQLLRQAFDLDAAPVRARLYATAHGVYQATVNAEPVGDEVLAPGFDSYRHRLSVQCYDVTALLHPGENVLGIALADGWWAGRIGITGSSAQFGDRTAATWQLRVGLADGSTRVIRPDETVVSSPGPWDYADLFVGERFDARRTRPGWDRAGHDATGWKPVSLAPVERATLVPFAGEPVRRVAELPAVSVRETDAGVVVDFGQVIAGRVRLTMAGLPAGRAVTVEHTETLDADGVWFRNILGINKEQTDVYVTGGAEIETFEPAFTYHGFRYARVGGVDALDPADIVAVVVASDLDYTGSLITSDARLNRLHENVVWSQRGNLVSVPTDCPQREKVGWTGDAQVFAPAASNNAIVAPFLDRWLANLRADQLDNGAVPITSPRSPFDVEAASQAAGLGGIVVAAGWSDAIALVPWTLYERYGDVRVLEENVDATLRWVEFQRREAAAALPSSLDGIEISSERRARQALLWNTGDQFGDWLAPSTLQGLPPHEAILVAPKLTGELVGPMFQARTLSVASAMLAVLGRDDEAAELAGRADAVRRAFAAEYVDADGALPVPLQGVHALALAFDMVPDAVRQATADRLADLVAANGDRLDTGFLGVPHLLDALWDGGHRGLARRVLWQSETPSWLYEVDAGATTIWESWDAIAPDGTPRPVSLNHYAFGCVDDWLYRRVAGIVSAAPGYRRAILQPDLESGLTSASASVWTPFGALAIDWRLDGSDATVSCTVPFGVEAVLAVGGEQIDLPPGRSTRTVPVAALAAASA